MYVDFSDTIEFIPGETMGFTAAVRRKLALKKMRLIEAARRARKQAAPVVTVDKPKAVQSTFIREKIPRPFIGPPGGPPKPGGINPQYYQNQKIKKPVEGFDKMKWIYIGGGLLLIGGGAWFFMRRKKRK